MWPDYDPPATVESANVRPGDTGGMSGKELDESIQAMFALSDELVAARAAGEAAQAKLPTPFKRLRGRFAHDPLEIAQLKGRSGLDRARARLGISRRATPH